MGRIRSIFSPSFSVMLASLLFVASARGAEPSPWLEIHSTHYTVITDAGQKTGKEVALRFEQMRAVFGSLLMKERLNEPLPLTILAFKNDKSYYQTAPLRQGQPIDAPGFFLSGEDQNFIVLNLFEPESWRAVAHDYAQMLLNYNYPPVQGWFDEGLAEYFSSIRLDDKNYEIGSDPELRGAARENSPGNLSRVDTPPKSFTELLSGEAWLSLPDLLTMKHDTSTDNEGMRDTLFYAQSWMMMHYLLHEQKLSDTGTYFGLVQIQHVPVQEAIVKAYGMTPEQLDQAIKNYFHSLKPLFTALDASKRTGGAQESAFQVYQFPEPVGPSDRTMTSKTLSETDAGAIVAEIKIRIPDRRETGLQELSKLATTQDPSVTKTWTFKLPKKEKEDTEAPLTTAVGNEIAHRALAWDDLQRGEFDACVQELGDAAALNPQDMWIRYYLSVMKYKQAQVKKTDMEGLPNLMQDLRAVLEWYPEFANAYDLLALARMQGGGPAAAMQAERAATQLSPRNLQYVYHLAEIYESDKRWDAARALLERLQTSGDAQIAAEAQSRLSELTAHQKYGVANASAASSAKLTPQPTPFDVLDQDAAKRTEQTRTSQSETIADLRPEKFIEGRLIAVDCSQSPVAILTVSSNGAVLKLRTADYNSLLLIGTDKFSCAWSDRRIAVNYKAGGLSDGDLVSVEVR
jgi:tetratricopeptide (TPR) repeat protein